MKQSRGVLLLRAALLTSPERTTRRIREAVQKSGSVERAAVKLDVPGRTLYRLLRELGLWQERA